MIPGLGVYDRYLLARLLKTGSVIFFGLLLLTLGTLLADSVSQVAQGKITADKVLELVSLRSVEAMEHVLPISVFYAALVVYGTAFRMREMAVMYAAAYSPNRLYKGLSVFLLLACSLMFLVVFYLAPWADNEADRMKRESRENMAFNFIQQGRFMQLPGNRGVMLLQPGENDEPNGNVFIYMEDAEKIRVVTASAALRQDDASSGRAYMVLEKGHQLEGEPGTLEWLSMHFSRYHLLSVREPPLDRAPELESLNLEQLLEKGGPEADTELAWRAGLVITIAVLACLALPFSYTMPRSAHSRRFLLGILVYMIYGNVTALARNWYEQSVTPQWLGLAWPHLLLLLLAVYAWQRQHGFRIQKA